MWQTQVKCGECPHQAFVPVTDDIIEKHLRGEGARASGGDFVAGVYPLLPEETCWFLAADFDEESWAADALAVLETFQANGVPAALERSRSGNGGHVWIFFCEPASARTARQLGAAMLTETMERRPEIGFASYDRFFPSQDTMPVGGFGNLIALPLQRRARELGNNVFVDQDLRPYDDQWKAKPSDIGIVAVSGAGLIKCEVASPSIDRLAVILPRVVRAASLQGFELVADGGSAHFKSETENIGFSIAETVKREKHVLTDAERAKEEAWERKRDLAARRNSWDNVFFDKPQFPEWDFNPTGQLSFEFERVYLFWGRCAPPQLPRC